MSPRMVVGLLNIPAICKVYLKGGSDRTLVRVVEIAYQTCYLSQSQCTDTGQTSHSTDPITPGIWQGSHGSTKVKVTGIGKR